MRQYCCCATAGSVGGSERLARRVGDMIVSVVQLHAKVMVVVFKCDADTATVIFHVVAYFDCASEDGNDGVLQQGLPRVIMPE